MKKFCPNCGNELDENSDFCVKCGKKTTEDNTKEKNNNSKKDKKKLPTWAIVVIVIVCLFVVVGVFGNNSEESSDTDKFQSNTKNKVTVVDFSTYTKAEIDEWCNNNKVNCSVSTEYSDTIQKDSFISQSIEKDKTIYEGDKITIKFSLGKEPTTEQKNALKKAESYSKTLHMSKQGIYNQLTSSFEGFDKDAAQYAIDNIEADWNANALEKAKSYQKTMNMSKNAIYNQLTSSFEGFTSEEAQYAIDHLDD